MGWVLSGDLGELGTKGEKVRGGQREAEGGGKKEGSRWSMAQLAKRRAEPTEEGGVDTGGPGGGGRWKLCEKHGGGGRIRKEKVGARERAAAAMRIQGEEVVRVAVEEVL